MSKEIGRRDILHGVAGSLASATLLSLHGEYSAHTGPTHFYKVRVENTEGKVIASTWQAQPHQSFASRGSESDIVLGGTERKINTQLLRTIGRYAYHDRGTLRHDCTIFALSFLEDADITDKKIWDGTSGYKVVHKAVELTSSPHDLPAGTVLLGNDSPLYEPVTNHHFFIKATEPTDDGPSLYASKFGKFNVASIHTLEDVQASYPTKHLQLVTSLALTHEQVAENKH